MTILFDKAISIKALSNAETLAYDYILNWTWIHGRLQSFPLQLQIEDGTDNDNFPKYVNTQIDDTVSWDDIRWIRSISSLPIVVKGILTGTWLCIEIWVEPLRVLIYM